MKKNLTHDEQFQKEWEGYTSATVASTTSNNIMSSEKPFVKTYRTFIRPREYGEFMWKFWHSNAVDSTWDNGAEAAANDLGGEWAIEEAYIADGGKDADGSIVPGTGVQITFGGKASKEVAPGESFWSDEVGFKIADDHFVAFTWTIATKSTGKVLPYNIETLLMSAYSAEGNCAADESGASFTLSEACTVLPHLLAYKKAVIKKIGFFGDSITQGVRTKVDGYEFWVSKIARGLGEKYGVWNIGSGWARAYDAASDGAWSYKARQNDEIVLCLGVNDIGTANRSYEQLFDDLTTIVSLLKENNPSCSIIMCTVPPFDFQDEQEKVWRNINKTIKAGGINGVDWIFDIAAVLSQQAPEDNLEKREFKSNDLDPHPNGLAGTAVAERFLEKYKKRSSKA